MLSVKPEWVENDKENVIKYALLYVEHRAERIYQNMKQRCNNPKSSRYERYGRRGIKICDEWLGKDGKQNFIEWALSNGYKPDLSIERIDIDKGYSPDNCKWIPLSEQSKNTRRTHIITHNGETMCLRDWCKKLNLKDNTIFYRAKKLDGNFEKALFAYHPYTKNDKEYCPKGHKYTPDNTAYTSQGYRYCKICKSLSKEKYNKNRRSKRRKQKSE